MQHDNKTHHLSPISPFIQTMQSIAGNEVYITGAAPLARLSYGNEMVLKQKAFTEFFRKKHIAGDWERLVPSPFSRLYRTTTKRRVVFAFEKFMFSMGDGGHDRPDENRNEAMLEPRQHTALYELLLKKLNEPMFSLVAKRCNYLIVRGSYKEFCLIFNMHKLDGPTVRKLKILGAQLSGAGMDVVSSFVFLDPSRSKYYLDKRGTESRVSIKKLFGPDTLRFSTGEQTYVYDALSFSQVNQSMVPLLLKKAAGLLDIATMDCARMRLVDLYCGYGLLTLYLGKRFGEAWGIDCDSASIRRARGSVAHCKDLPALCKMRFMTGQITSRGMEEMLPLSGDIPEVVVLDPPRRGTEKGVIGAIANRRPEKILHIFCNVDIIPEELEQWKRVGYSVSRVLPMDMFPGTPNLEIMVLLIPR